jgi:membrane-bound lytic murein transglycosylase F
MTWLAWRRNPLWRRAALCLGLFLTAGCSPDPLSPPDQSGELVVVTRNSPTTYFLDAEDKSSGFEHDLVTLFAGRQGWKVRFVLADTLEELFETVASGQAHLAAAGLTASDERRSRLRFGPTYGQVKEWVVCRALERPPRKLEDLVGLRVEVVAGSSHADRLNNHRSRLPDLNWVEMEMPGSEELLERVDLGLADCTVVDSDTLDVARNFHPGLRQAFVLESAQPQAWVIGRVTKKKKKKNKNHKYETDTTSPIYYRQK